MLNPSKRYRDQEYFVFSIKYPLHKQSLAPPWHVKVMLRLVQYKILVVDTGRVQQCWVFSHHLCGTCTGSSRMNFSQLDTGSSKLEAWTWPPIATQSPQFEIQASFHRQCYCLVTFKNGIQKANVPNRNCQDHNCPYSFWEIKISHFL